MRMRALFYFAVVVMVQGSMRSLATPEENPAGSRHAAGSQQMTNVKPRQIRDHPARALSPRFWRVRQPEAGDQSWMA
jgi:hypothetical protein